MSAMTTNKDRSRGGVARAKAMTASERSEAASLAAKERWTIERGLPRETHAGQIRIDQLAIDCAVLDNGARVLSTRGLGRVFGSRMTGTNGALKVPPFIASNAFIPFISEELMVRLTRPIIYRPKQAGRTAFGYEATLLLDICNVLLDARERGVLVRRQQLEYAAIAQVLVRAFAKVGIIALVDEATGYQADRARDELQTLLRAYVAEELMPWVKRFPNEFFRQVYRIQGWKYTEGVTKSPRYVGKVINRYIYGALPAPVLDELRRRNPTVNGHRKVQHHRLLTDDVGHPQLASQVAIVTALMRASKGKDEFDRLFRAACPKVGEQTDLAFPIASPE